MPSSNSALRARSNALSPVVRLATARADAMPKLSLYMPAVRRHVQVAGRLVRAGEPRADHGRRRAGGEGERDVARDAARPRRPRRACRARARPRRTRATAENCGRPTPVIIRVVHIAPGPTPTLTMSAPASTRSRVPSADTTLPATIGHAPASSARTAAERLEHPLLVAVRGVDDEHVDAGVEQSRPPWPRRRR